MKRSFPQKIRKKDRKSDKGHRQLSGDDQLVWGIHSVMEALRAKPGAVKEVFIEDGRSGRRIDELVAAAQQQGVPVTSGGAGLEKGDRNRTGRIDQDGSQGVAARISLPLSTFEELLAKLKRIDSPAFLLALDSIQDPHNMGAIIRSAVAAGVHGLILPKDRSAPISGTVIKVSAGGVFHLDICRVTNLVSCFKKMKDENIWIFGAAKEGASQVYDVDLTVPVCLVIGSEGKGLRPLVAEHCDMALSIPMHGALDSLNASVAAGIILFETVRQRKKHA